MQTTQIVVAIAAATAAVSARNVVLPEDVVRQISSSNPVILTGNFENFRLTTTATTTSDGAAQPTTLATSVRTEILTEGFAFGVPLIHTGNHEGWCPSKPPAVGAAQITASATDAGTEDHERRHLGGPWATKIHDLFEPKSKKQD
ncbi:hypothetical protein ISF_01436 [Cordyceps fumosorosea ARSEF 2679]|uniref:Uncharacterized protein n=1 Tax=Cordyceps fumosorosea (strain ARSEF 2679) TaxID=1081104 RepID=A0A168DAI9_CORFA|nr:hypothetical protein ISF_01436 [Cordyceps fumosorosea ARSEF 2679]OAA72363.1 hypothetical protein ISF_01436 [Cordyceps fumosorosea ARSEF 2679]